jgi:DNA-binding Lrp family transcriptional regulator
MFHILNNRRDMLETSDAACRSLAPAVDNAFAILDLLGRRPRGMGVSEIARELGLSKSSCFNILSTLLRAGAVEKRGPSTAWHLGPKLVELGTAARRGYSARAAVRALLQAFVDREKLVCLVGQVLGGFGLQLHLEVGTLLKLGSYLESQYCSHQPLRRKLNLNRPR